MSHEQLSNSAMQPVTSATKQLRSGRWPGGDYAVITAWHPDQRDSVREEA